MAVQNRPQPCDVWAVRIATNTRRSLGQTGAEGLTELQRRIYEFITRSGGGEPPGGGRGPGRERGRGPAAVQRFAPLRVGPGGEARKRGLPGAVGVNAHII